MGVNNVGGHVKALFFCALGFSTTSSRVWPWKRFSF